MLTPALARIVSAFLQSAEEIVAEALARHYRIWRWKQMCSERKDRPRQCPALRKNTKIYERAFQDPRLRGIYRRVGTGTGPHIHPCAGSGGWRKAGHSEPNDKARNARRRKTHRPTAFEAVQLIKPPASQGESDLPKTNERIASQPDFQSPSEVVHNRQATPLITCPCRVGISFGWVSKR